MAKSIAELEAELNRIKGVRAEVAAQMRYLEENVQILRRMDNDLTMLEIAVAKKLAAAREAAGSH